MASTITTDDLKAYALWLSGEPTDGTSDYDERILQHMQTIYNTLVNGGVTGTRDLAVSAGLYSQIVNIPTTDWLWLRKFPPFVFNTTPARLSDLGVLVVTNSSDIISFGVAPTGISMAGWRLKLRTQGAGIPNPPVTVPRILAHTIGATTAQLDAPWPQETQSVSDYVFFQSEYALPADFARFHEAPRVHAASIIGQFPPVLNIGSADQVQDRFPFPEIAQGVPTEAARIDPATIQLNRWDTQSYRIEFSYIIQPPVLAVGQTPAQEPLVPIRYRHMLSMGAAMIVMHDKNDERTDSMASQFREILTHMGNEYRKELQAGSKLAGRHLYRQSGNRRGLLRSASGLPLFALLAALVA